MRTRLLWIWSLSAMQLINYSYFSQIFDNFSSNRSLHSLVGPTVTLCDGSIYSLGKSSHQAETYAEYDAILSFITTHAKYDAICSNRSNNVVLPRHVQRISANIAHTAAIDKGPSYSRPWSLESDFLLSYLHFHRHREKKLHLEDKCSSNKHLKPVPYCDSINGLEESISVALADHRCRIRWFQPIQLCDLFKQFSIIWWHGDSLTRHQVQALFVLLTGNLQYGGYGLSSQSSEYISRPTIYEEVSSSSCSCDGQFSEALSCRNAQWLREFERMDDISHSNICESLLQDQSRLSSSDTAEQSPSPTRFIWHQYDVDLDHISLSCPSSKKSIFIYLQGGPHYDNNYTLAISEYFDPMISRIYKSFSDCISIVHILFSGSVVVSPALEQKYPTAHRLNIEKYNNDMKKWFHSKYFHQNFPRMNRVLILDLWNVTASGLNSTSDGFHSLTDVNLLKTVAVLNFMNLIERNA